jgi:pyridoxal phosphate enzyme (YggS family)
MPDSLSTRLSALQSLIAQAHVQATLAAPTVQLVAVSKQQPRALLEEVLSLGQRVFGENKVQEAQAHWAELRTHYTDIELRLIGPLQSNKAREAVQLFDIIETLDRPKIVDALAEAMAKEGKKLPCLIQVNTGEEPQKAGCLPRELEALYRHATETAGLNVVGLMAVPPADKAPAPHFAYLHARAKEFGLSQLSMGMSGDFETAIAFGATHVRIGTALFGERSY